jgi:DNA-binding transcriptional MerR regulator
MTSHPTETDRKFSLDELAALVDLSRRTIRYYVQIGLVDRPIGETRAAYYTSKHVEQLLAVRKWSEAGISLERIRELLQGADAPAPASPRKPGTVEVWSHLVIADGIELNLDPGRAGMTSEEVRKFTAEVMSLYQRVKQKRTKT